MDLSTVEGFATTLANRIHFVGWDFTAQFGEVPTNQWVESVDDPEHMRFSVSRYCAEADDMVPVGVYEVSVRKVEGR